MATYTTVGAIHDQVVQISSATNITSAEKAGQIERAESIINAKIGHRYSVPFTAGSIPPLIETICVDLATARILRNTGYKDSSGKKDWYSKFESAMELLTEVASGTISLLDSAGTLISTRITSDRDAISTTKNYKPIFDMRDSISWEVDEDLIDAEDDAAE